MTQSTPVSEAERARRRRAVQAGLSAFLTGENLVTAVAVWEDEFSDGPSLALQGFARRVCDMHVSTASRQEIYRSLVSAMSASAGESDRLGTLRSRHRRALGPGGQVRAEQEQGADPHATQAAAVFAAVMGEFLRQADRAKFGTAPRIRMYLVAQLPQLRLVARTGAEVREWLSGTRERVGAPLPADIRRGLVHIAYVAACEYLGPEVADRLLSGAVKAAEAMPEARLSSPRLLL